MRHSPSGWKEIRFWPISSNRSDGMTSCGRSPSPCGGLKSYGGCARGGRSCGKPWPRQHDRNSPIAGESLVIVHACQTLCLRAPRRASRSKTHMRRRKTSGEVQHFERVRNVRALCCSAKGIATSPPPRIRSASPSATCGRRGLFAIYNSHKDQCGSTGPALPPYAMRITTIRLLS